MTIGKSVRDAKWRGRSGPDSKDRGAIAAGAAPGGVVLRGALLRQERAEVQVAAAYWRSVMNLVGGGGVRA